MLRVLACGFERQVLGLDLWEYDAADWGTSWLWSRTATAMGMPTATCCALKNRIVSEPNAISAAHSPQDQHGATHQNARSSVSVRMVHGAYGPGCVGDWPLAKRRTIARRMSSARQEQHQNRQRNRHERRQIDAGMNRGRVKTSGHRNRSAGDEIAKQHRTGISP